MREEQVLVYLKGACPGRRYTVKSADLEAAPHIISGTDLRKTGQPAPQKGVPIASSRDGYFTPSPQARSMPPSGSSRAWSGTGKRHDGLERALEGFAVMWNEQRRPPPLPLGRGQGKLILYPSRFSAQAAPVHRPLQRRRISPPRLPRPRPAGHLQRP